MDSQAMRDYIKNFSLDNGPRGSQGYSRVLLQLFGFTGHGNQGYTRVLLQIFGFTGHGKSCFINSCKYVMDDEPYTVHAKVAGSDVDPETMIRNAYKLTDTITLVDNRGCMKMDKDETGAIYAQLGNFLPLDSEVKWQTNFSDMMEILLNAEEQEQSMDLIVPVLVWSAKKQIVSGTEEKELKEILLKAKHITGLSPTVVITNKLSEHLPDTQEKFRRMGVENMFPVENYTEQDHLKTRGRHEGTLKCLYEIIKDVEFRMKQTRDPRKEKKERKRILYEFANERETERVETECAKREEEREYTRREEERERTRREEERELARREEERERTRREEERERTRREEERERTRREEVERQIREGEREVILLSLI